MLFQRVKPLDKILETAEKKGLERQLGALQLTLLGVGAIIGTGIFVLTAAAAQKAGPGMMWSFVIAGAVCAVAALCYSEIASMVPVSGSAYTYTYAVMGELLAWMVGWALILEYAVAASAVSVGWSGYFMGLVKSATGFELPAALVAGPVWSFAGGIPDPGLFPAENIQAGYDAILADPVLSRQALQYSVSEGYLPLRQWIAEVRASADDVQLKGYGIATVEELARYHDAEGRRAVLAALAALPPGQRELLVAAQKVEPGASWD